MSLEKIAEGAGHEIFLDSNHPTTLIKKPKAILRSTGGFRRVQEDLELAKEHFGQWLPETSVEKSESSGYIIRQRRVENASHIQQVLLAKKPIRAEVERILDANRAAIASKDRCGLDFLGLEGSYKCALSRLEKFRGTPAESLCIRPVLQATQTVGRKTPLPFPSNAVQLWDSRDTEPSMANLIHGNIDGKEGVFAVDLSLVHLRGKGTFESLRSRFLQSWNRRNMKKYLGLDM